MIFDDLFFESLLWSTISIIENNSCKRKGLINQIILYLKESNNNFTINAENFNCDDSSNKYMSLFCEYKKCYENTLNADKFKTKPQTGRYSNDFEELDFLGKGRYGLVYKVKCKNTDKEYAVKKRKIKGLNLNIAIFLNNLCTKNLCFRFIQ